jgi:hypothetical protein
VSSPVDLVSALGRLLSRAEERRRFTEDRQAWVEALGLADLAERELLLRLEPSELEAQARVLIEKRAGEVAERLPRTRARLGEEFAPLFARFVELDWPRGHLRHLYDALGFLHWLRGAAPRAPHSLDELAVVSELARREGRAPVQAGLAHHADLPLSAAYVGLRFGPRRLRLLLPLPLPSALGRRWAWKRPPRTP